MKTRDLIQYATQALELNLCVSYIQRIFFARAHHHTLLVPPKKYSAKIMAAILVQDSDTSPENNKGSNNDPSSTGNDVQPLSGKQLQEEIQRRKALQQKFNEDIAKKAAELLAASKGKAKTNGGSDTKVRVKQDLLLKAEWAKRVRTEVLYPGEHNILVYNPNGSQQNRGVYDAYDFDVEWTLPLSYLFVSKVLKTKRLSHMFFMPGNWQESDQKMRVVINTYRHPQFVEGLKLAARKCIPLHLKLVHFTAPTQNYSATSHLVVQSAEHLNDDYIVAIDVFATAVRSAINKLNYESNMTMYNTSAEARQQFALLQVREKRRMASAREALSMYSYDENRKQLFKPQKQTPTYVRSAVGLMNWPQYSRLRQSPSLQQGLKAANFRNSR